MDPLSLTASIIALLQLTSSLTSYLNDVRNATADQKKLAIEASSLSSLLISLRYRVEEAHTGDEWFNQIRLLGVENGPLDQFRRALQEMVDQTMLPNSRTRDQVMSALKWKLTKSKVETSLQQIERLKSLTLIALSNDAFKLSQIIHDKVTHIDYLTQQVQRDVEQLQLHASGDVQGKLSRWLDLPDPSVNYIAAQKKRHPGTGSWLVDGQIFRQWKASKSSLLWLYGKAGCGKTVLSATALEHLLSAAARRTDDIIIAYFYFDFNDIRKQHLQNAARSLLLQFAIQLPDGLEALQQLYRKYGDGHQQPSDDQIQSLLYRLIEQSKQTYIIFDALDECEDRDELLSFFENLVGSQHEICILATSRQERDIEESLRPITDHIINIESAAVDSDIDAYVRGRLSTDRRLKKWPASVKDEIARELRTKANGMFRWVYCQLDSLQNCVQLRDLRTTLSALPKTLDETYYRIIQSIESNGHLSKAITILQWLCFAMQPLELSELVDILAIQNKSDGGGGFDPDERLPAPDDIFRICSTLINYEESSISDIDGEDGSNDGLSWSIVVEDGDRRSSDTTRVQLAHFSVKEYLLSDRCFLRSDFQPAISHAVIGQNCLHYLLHVSHDTMERRSIVDSYPLASYSARNWWRHIREIGEGSSVSIVDLSYHALTRRKTLLVWNRLDKIDRSTDDGVFRRAVEVKVLATPLYYAVRTGLVEVVRRLTVQKVDVNARGGFHGTALTAASYDGHEKIVQMLLQAGAEVNAKPGFLNTALQAASSQGHEKIVEMLLQAGAEVNTKPGSSSTALQAASSQGHEKIVEILLQAGAEVNAKLGAFGTALTAASLGGYEKIVQILLGAGAEVNVKPGLSNAALTAASSQGHEKIVQILLHAGAEVNAKPGASGTALTAASSQGHEKIVEMLLQAGAEVNAKLGASGTALTAASYRGQEKIVQILLQAGADVNAPGENFGTALQAASYRGHESVSQILLKAGAELNV